MEAISKVQLNKIVKTISIIVIGSILLTISAKIKNSFLSSSNDHANFCSAFSWFGFWI